MAGQNDVILPVRVDELARCNPEKTYAEVSVFSSTGSQGSRRITYRQLANAVNGAALWFLRTFGPSNDFETLAYCGPNDLRYPIAVLGAVKAGYKLLIFSPRNSLAAQASLFERLNCKTLIVSDPEPPFIKSLTASIDIQKRTFDTLETLLEIQHHHVPYRKSFDEAKNEPLVVIHTSGSTGLPKPLIIPHSFATSYANIQQSPPPEGFINQSTFYRKRRMMHTLPMFHAAGMYAALITTILSETIYVPLRPDVVPSARTIREALESVQVDVVFMAPSQVDEVAKDAEFRHYLSSKVETICFAGGSVPQAIGDIVAQDVRLVSFFGSSEMGQSVQIQPASSSLTQDWSYFRWDQDRTGMRFYERAEGLFELVVVRDLNKTGYQPPFTIFEDASEFPTKDLFAPHPSRAGLWKYSGRLDDIIVLLNGEKTNPVTMEGRISSHPRVRSALVAGAGRFQTSLLVEMIDKIPDAHHLAAALEDIWPTVEEANAECPAHARVYKDYILFTSAGKPMVRAGKGTVVRRATLQLYADELEALYSSNDLASSCSVGDPEAIQSILGNHQALLDLVLSTTKELTGWKVLDPDTDLFTSGMDSLQAIQLARRLKSRLHLPGMSLSVVYRYSSPLALVTTIQKSSSKVEDPKLLQVQSGVELITETLEKYKSFLDALSCIDASVSSNSAESCGRRHRVLLTGWSGFLGSFVLQSLLQNDDVEHVYCISRRLTPRSSRPELTNNAKVTFLQGDPTKNNLGLQDDEFHDVQAAVSLIIHAAWAVDFNRGLQAFDSQLAGIVELIKTSLGAPRSPGIFFISSISAVQRSKGAVPEAFLADVSVAASTGYGQSKYIAERLLEYSAQTLGRKIGILRAGQISGPAQATGTWNRHEWLPSLVISSAYLGAVPDSLVLPEPGQSHEARIIDWVPVDYIAKVITELALDGARVEQQLQSNAANSRVYHAVHPCPTSWQALLPTVVAELTMHAKKKAAQREQELSPKNCANLGSTGEISVIPLSEWVEKLHASSSQVSDGIALRRLLEQNPGIKLLDFYSSMANRSSHVQLETKDTEAASDTLRSMEKMDPAWFQKWMRDWFSV